MKCIIGTILRGSVQGCRVRSPGLRTSLGETVTPRPFPDSFPAPSEGLILSPGPHPQPPVRTRLLPGGVWQPQPSLGLAGPGEATWSSREEAAGSMYSALVNALDTRTGT